MRALVVDNYDSFTFNLVQYLGELGAEPIVVRNDAIDIAAATELAPDRLVISPGPGRPEDAGVSVELIRALGPTVRTLGVCLGHQAIVAAFGGTVELAPEPRHGKTSDITHDDGGVFRGLPNPFPAGRYHSLLVPEEGLPEELEVTAHTADGEIMGLRWKGTCCVGVQFHPESVLTPKGPSLLKNFLGAPGQPC